MPSAIFLTNRRKLNSSGVVHPLILAGLVLVMLFGLFNGYGMVDARTRASMPEIRSGIANYCLDDHHNGGGTDAEVDSWACNGTAAQRWTMNGDTIRHGSGRCLDVAAGATAAGSGVVLNACNGSPGEQWTIDLGGFQNPRSGLCLAVPHGETDVQLTIESCDGLSHPNETWAADIWTAAADADPTCTEGTEGDKVACEARRQWAAWQAGSPTHQTLLTDYTDGNSYEQWCADFISYVYKEAGYPFTGGERDGWDEYDANDMQYRGFTWHSAAHYTPKPGDVAFFDYPGGHVELVVSGGAHPVFIYGDSGTVDPSTGNGDMNEDMLTSDGSAGQVTYYLSPD